MTEYKSEASRQSAETRRRNIAKAKAQADAWAEQWCGRDHQTWGSKARCLYGKRVQVVGEGPVAVIRGAEIHLYASTKEVPGVPSGAQVVRLHRGLHRKGEGK